MSENETETANWERVTIRSDGKNVGRGNPLPAAGGVRPRVVYEDAQENSGWITHLDNVRIDGTPATFAGEWMDIRNWAGLWVHIRIQSTSTPTDIRVVPQFCEGYGQTPVYDFVEGLWASLMWEDADTADPGINQAFKLPIDGEDWVRFNLIGTGVSAQAYFDVTIRVRPYLGPIGMAHA